MLTKLIQRRETVEEDSIEHEQSVKGIFYFENLSGARSR